MPDDEIAIDLANDTIRLFGVRYSLGVFRTLGLGPIGAVVRIMQREDDVVILQSIRLPEGFDADS